MKPDNRWAVVTGASSGIGRALALEFARAGFSVLLTGRNEAALAETASGCAGFKVETDVIPADLSQSESIDALAAMILAKPRRYEVLVNNAGFGIHADFASSDIDEEIRLLNVQLTAALKLTKALLPSMIAGKSGRILNVASVYGYSPVPHQSVYSACKAFLVSFSASIRNELRNSGVTVTVFAPGITQSQFRVRAGIADRNSGMSAESAARIAFEGTIQGKAVVIPGLPNRLFVLVSRILPGGAFANVVNFINRIRGVSRSRPR
jgi:short-subunit dehydrogenase